MCLNSLSNHYRIIYVDTSCIFHVVEDVVALYTSRSILNDAHGTRSVIISKFKKHRTGKHRLSNFIFQLVNSLIRNTYFISAIHIAEMPRNKLLNPARFDNRYE